MRTRPAHTDNAVWLQSAIKRDVRDSDSSNRRGGNRTESLVSQLVYRPGLDTAGSATSWTIRAIVVRGVSLGSSVPVLYLLKFLTYQGLQRDIVYSVD